jgi:hypothetical protein
MSHRLIKTTPMPKAIKKSEGAVLPPPLLVLVLDGFGVEEACCLATSVVITLIFQRS